MHRKESIAVVGMAQHVSAHDEFTQALPEGCEAQWVKQVEEWEGDHSLINPYFLPTRREFSINHAIEFFH